MYEDSNTLPEGGNENISIAPNKVSLSKGDIEKSGITLPVSYYGKVYDLLPERRAVAWPDFFTRWYEADSEDDKKQIPLFSCDLFKPFKGREKGLTRGNVDSVSGLLLDYDDDHGVSIEQAESCWADYEYFLHTTYSHQVPGVWKDAFRMLLPFPEPVTVAEYEAFLKGWALPFAAGRNAKFKPLSVGHPGYFLPTRRPSTASEYNRHNSGTMLDPRVLAPTSTSASTERPLTAFEMAWKEAEAKESSKYVVPELAVLEEHCSFMRHGREDAARLSEPEWRSWLSIAARCEDGVKLAHEVSSAYAGYSKHETQAKIDRLLTESGPHTCAHIEDQWASSKCGECPLRGKVRSPISIPAALSGTVVERAVQRLTEFVNRACAEGSRDDGQTIAAWARDQEIAAILGDVSVVSALGSAYRADPSHISAAIARLSAVPGMRQRANGLERAIRETAKRQDQEEKATKRKEAQSRAAGGLIADRLRSVLFGHRLPEGLMCPEGWDLQAHGIRRIRILETGDYYEEEVTHRPVLVEGRLRDIHDNTITLALGWPTSAGRWQLHTAPRIKVADARQLVTLAAHDAPVTSNSASNLVAFLDDFESANSDRIPEALVSGQMGWQGASDSRCFLWGRNQIRKDDIVCSPAIENECPSDWVKDQIHLLVSDDGLRGLCEGYRSQGTWSGWLEAVQAASPYPALFVALYASLVPPLMDCIPTLPNFIVDFCGETSMGKTTTLRFAASAWGSPEERGAGIIYSWDATRVFLERSAALADYHPLFLDDTKRARRAEDVGKTLYDYASGIGRARGSLQGVQRTTRAHGVLISTGEAPATSFTNDGGTRARTLCLWGSPFGGTNRQTEAAVRSISAKSLAHFGHAGPKLVQWLLGNPQARDFVKKEYAAQLEHWANKAEGNSVASRVAQYVAAMAVVRRILHEVFEVPEPDQDALSLAWSAALEGTADSDRAADALRDVLSWATGQQHRFWGRGEDGSSPFAISPGQGWLGTWSKSPSWTQIAILPTELQAFLQRANYDTQAVLRTWCDREWIMRDGSHRTVKTHVGEMRQRCVVIKRQAADLVTEDTDPDKND